MSEVVKQAQVSMPGEICFLACTVIGFTSNPSG